MFWKSKLKEELPKLIKILNINILGHLNIEIAILHVKLLNTRPTISIFIERIYYFHQLVCKRSTFRNWYTLPIVRIASTAHNFRDCLAVVYLGSAAVGLNSGIASQAFGSSSSVEIPPLHCQQEVCRASVKEPNDQAISRQKQKPRAEQARELSLAKASIPFRISVDGQVIDESGRQKEEAIGVSASSHLSERQRKTDVDLSAVDIQVKFDGLDVRTILNVSTSPVRHSYQAGDYLTFLTTANYPDFIKRAEIRIHEHAAGSTASPLMVLPVEINGRASWKMPTGPDKKFDYVLRVYDEKGRFDETSPLSLNRTSAKFAAQAKQPAVAPGRAEDRTAFRNIQVHGGVITVFGRSIPPGYKITVLGDEIAIDGEQSFVVQRILRPGKRRVDVAVKGISKSGGLSFSREINIPHNDWFYVALADFTVGQRFADDNIELAREGDYDGYYKKGRLAFYLKGKIRGRYLLTASADTGEEDIDYLFRGLDSKKRDDILSRIDPDEYYPVYGDESVLVDDAPTSGKFYVRLSAGDSHVMWGNYKTVINGSEFINSDRSLYGAEARYVSEGTTAFGDRKANVTVYAAQPETVPQKDEFLATGGSSYFLKRQDMTIGSETVSVEVRNAVTGTVLSKKVLSEETDYTINYSQGLIMLQKALSPSLEATDAVRTFSLGDVAVYLVVNYEYTPVASDINGYAYGGRAQRWIHEKVRVGVSHSVDKSGANDHEVVGADIGLRLSASSFIEAEVAQSEGAGFSSAASTDGGLTLTADSIIGEGKRSGTAWRAKGKIDLKELGLRGIGGKLSGSYEKRISGFAELSELPSEDQEAWSLRGHFDITETVALNVTYNELRLGDDDLLKDSGADISWQATNRLKVTAGAAFKRVRSHSAAHSGKSGYNGTRSDGGLRLSYSIDEDRSAYVFGQGTLSVSGDVHRNDRIGVGGEVRLTEKITANAEISHGTSGLGGLAALNYSPTAEDKYYVGYRLDADRASSLDNQHELTGTDLGSISAGAYRTMSDKLAIYADNSYDLFGLRKSLTQTYGVVYTPDTSWSADASIVAGSISDRNIDPQTGRELSDYQRQAASLALRYNDQETGLRGSLKGEVRLDDSQDNTRDAKTFLLASGVKVEASDDWEMLADTDLVMVRGASDLVEDGIYVETSLGFAYRPVNSDKLNALVRYTYLNDTSGFDQEASSGTGLEQQSHILQADVSYSLFPWLTVGSRQAVRVGKYREVDDSEEWQSNVAYLGTAKAEFHVIRQWDALLEGRMLHHSEAETTDYGALAAVYRHVGDNLKLGVGYNFGRFSDDPRDLTLDDKGVFFNLVGKF